MPSSLFSIPGQTKLSFILSLLLAVTACNRSPQTYVDRGNRFFEAGKYKDAELAYKNALQNSPQHGEAHFRLAALDAKTGNTGEAYKEMELAAYYMPEDVKALSLFAEMNLNLYNADPEHRGRLFDRATEIAAKVLKLDPAGAEANVLNGTLQLMQKKPELAVDFMRKAVQANPKDSSAKLGLATALAQKGDNAAAAQIAREAIEADRTFGGAYDFLFRQYQESGNSDEAGKILWLRVANNPKDAGALMELARFCAATNQQASMKEAVRRVSEHLDTFPNGRLLAGDFYLNIGKTDEALAQFSHGLERAEDATVYRKRLVRIYAVQKQWTKAEEQLEAILRAHPADDEAKIVRAGLWLDEGRADKLDAAIADLRAEFATHPTTPDLPYQLGNALARKGDWTAAGSQWTRAAAMDTRYLPARYSLARFYLDRGMSADAQRISEEITAQAPQDPAARLLHAECLTAAGRFQVARAELNSLAAGYPGNAGVALQFGLLATAENKHKEAESILGRLDGDARKTLRRALAASAERVYGANGSWAEAIAILRNLDDSDPQDVSVSLQLAQTYVSAGRLAEAEGLCRRVLETYPNDPNVLNAMAYVTAESGGNPERALAYAEQGRTLATSPALSDSLADTVGWIYVKKKMYPEAIKVLKALAAKSPGEPVYRYHLAMAFYRMGNSQQARAELEAAVANQPGPADRPKIQELLLKL